MVRKLLMPLVFLVACLWFSSCDLDDDTPNFYFTSLDVVDVDMPESFELNETYDIDVTYVRLDGCTYFEGFDVVKTGETDREVLVVGSRLTDENIGCTQVVEEVVATMQFHVIFTGEYHFRFYAGQDDNDNAIYLEYDVPVDGEANTD
ncbi:hypothetical protein J0X14_01335 [Muricauda sp. CAU 1633]|uniref:hypothetical protein n=1 Tax=Allomuricauda sp. CAU 1633 TaxID=2816036 RepID=UPI001A8DF289|nr:hypothetical protein [Muricauda sp. CAU 1633]MBO0320924.1 hypothetical protein [Muricauda sp. CAU 1633]